ncbi:MAG: FecR domain-containing protein [bacterium]
MKILSTLTILFTLLSLMSVESAADDKDVALMLKTRGQVQFGRSGRRLVQARRGSRIHSGVIVTTGDNSLAALIFTDDKSQLKIRSNSSVTINGKRQKKGILKRLSLRFGELWAKVTKQESDLRVETPSGVATVKGTEFNALFVDNNFFIYCRSGLMEIFNQFGTMMLGANEMARLSQGAAPERLEGDPDEIFDLAGDSERTRLEIDLEGPDGEQKKLIIDFDSQQQ